MTAGQPRGQDGLASLGLLGVLAGVLVVAVVVVVDVGAWLWAASRAQAAADGAALAAVVADGDPRLAAREVAVLAGGDLARCDCAPGTRRATVAVRLPVGGLVLHRVWASHVDATATAEGRWVLDARRRDRAGPCARRSREHAGATVGGGRRWNRCPTGALPPPGAPYRSSA